MDGLARLPLPRAAAQQQDGGEEAVEDNGHHPRDLPPGGAPARRRVAARPLEHQIAGVASQQLERETAGLALYLRARELDQRMARARDGDLDPDHIARDARDRDASPLHRPRVLVERFDADTAEVVARL